MEYREFKEIFCISLRQNNLEIFDEKKIETFYRFTERLMEVNAVTNLTAIRNIPDVISKHLVDSLLAAKYLPEGARVLDLGCGPGFPSIPLAISRPDLKIVALDSTAKKIAFVQECIDLLNLASLTAIAGRAEDRNLSAKLGTFDVVVSRAVAKMSILSELCLPYVRVGGFLLALKAAKAEDELTEAKKAIRILGGGKTLLHQTQLIIQDGSSESRCLIEVPKANCTPSTYPRAYAVILKKPL
ncbi:MAG: 16S rRNA (guanine(527)-N(7))-methyltransferase RsmG [Clostridia bacterium]|nr:16S rRNA (guanine(527)-N(7))-methyltransferase RsmG [Clostridia bacterium]